MPAVPYKRAASQAAEKCRYSTLASAGNRAPASAVPSGAAKQRPLGPAGTLVPRFYCAVLRRQIDFSATSEAVLFYGVRGILVEVCQATAIASHPSQKTRRVGHPSFGSPRCSAASEAVLTDIGSSPSVGTLHSKHASMLQFVHVSSRSNHARSSGSRR
jgi:hypothetical protein